MKQGCPLSPILSNIFQNDLHEIFNDSCFPISLGDIKLNSLSWAYDLVLLSSTPEGLQNCLNNLSEYCSKWCITINVKKTQSIMFGKGKSFTLNLNGEKITQTDRYCYLGVTIHKSGKVKYAVEDRIKRASRAINMLQGALSTCAW